MRASAWQVSVLSLLKGEDRVRVPLRSQSRYKPLSSILSPIRKRRGEIMPNTYEGRSGQTSDVRGQKSDVHIQSSE